MTKTKCVVCERDLVPAPTELGWMHVRLGEGLCFDCIESNYRAMIVIKKADQDQTK